MATEISSIGKEALLSRLFEGSGRTNERGCAFSGDGDFSTVHKVFMEKVDFDLTYNPLRHLGHKLALNVIGELYARFSSPVGLEVSPQPLRNMVRAILASTLSPLRPEWW